MVVDVILLSAFLATAVILLLAVRDFRRYNSKGHLPPGPTPFPILGNVLDVPRSNVGSAFSALTKKHGDVVYFNLLGQPMIVIGSIKAALDLLDKKSANFSGRPVSAVMKLVGLDSIFALMQYGPQWRRHRRAFHLSFGIERIANHRPIQLTAARRLLCRLLTSTHSVEENISMLVADTSLAAVYGIDMSAKDGELYRMVDTMRGFVDPLLLPGGCLLEMFPSLQHLPPWLPGMHIMHIVEEGRNMVRSTFDRLDLMWAVANQEGRAREAMVTRILDGTKEEDPQAADMKELCSHVAASTVLASTETTHAVMEAFFLAAAMHPDCQKAAHEELDTAIGPDRLPEFSDFDRLPYVRAFIKEVMRWHTVTPMGLPHATVDDDEYDGHFIPSGTIVNVNMWALSRDASEYPDPDAFKPDRFLGSDKDKLPRDPIDYTFGFGRRICPGRHFAAASFFIYCASVLHVYDIMPPKDGDGNPVAMEYRAKDDLLSHVEGYDYIVKPRSAKAQSLVADLMF
ncbi:hypothetical protein V8D89_003914 [Ganoderma adspersum]